MTLRSSWVLLVLLFSLSKFAWGQRPIVSYVDKLSAPIGEIVTISGAGFDEDPDNLQVLFGNAPAEIVFASEYLIEAKIPPNATWGPIRVTNLTSNLSGTSTQTFNIAFGGGAFDRSSVDPPFNVQSFLGLYDLCNCDFNNDGKLDIATAHQVDVRIDVQLNTSTINQLSFVSEPIPLGPNNTTTNITCGDLNNDGRPDLVAGRRGQPQLFIFLMVYNA